MSEVVIKADKVSKDFKFSTARANTLKSIFTGAFRKKDSDEKIQHALKEVSFEIRKGEFFGIVGRNGSGKSTLLKILAGIYQPNKGSVGVSGRLVPFIELGVGFNPELTGRENVYMNGALLNFSKKEVDQFYKEVVDFAELEKFMDKKLKNYSSGMQVRLAFSMAIRAKADILLIDEVLAVGDADFQRKCFNYFREIKRQKLTVVFVSHDMNTVREFCDKAMLVDAGKIVAEGSPTKIADEYTKLFIQEERGAEGALGTESRKGTGKVRISNYDHRIVLKDKSEDVVVAFDVEAKSDASNLVVGFRCKSADDKHLFGSNNSIQGQKIQTIKQGKKLRFKFDFANMLNNGTYLVDLAAENADGEIYDWIFDAIKIDVRTEKRTSFLVDPKVNLDIEHGK
ncbi:MAG TPA: ABC transporter ATP-binding protein [Patescibacteria group bacterium]|nr:ABC transporter ATP-binding protein [Patescibacteria group bacterium]